MVSTLEQMQVPNGTGPGVRRSKRPLLASRTRCNVLWKPPKFGNKVKIGIKVHVIHSQIGEMSYQLMSEKRTQWKFNTPPNKSFPLKFPDAKNSRYTVVWKFKMVVRKCKTSWSQKGWCNKPTKLQFQFKYGKFWCSQNATNQPKSTVDLG